jgi:S-adenosylmethionine:tRNA ribosyltransferase-isomerase
MKARTRFTLPPGLAATEPPEERGLARDEVRLLVAEADRRIRHSTFRDLASFLAPGDLVVVNTSATRAAAVDGLRADGRPVTVHVSHRVPDGDSWAGDEWVVELRSPGGAQRIRDGRVGELLRLPRGVTAVLRAAQPDPARSTAEACPADQGRSEARRRSTGGTASRLWRARIPVEGGVAGWLGRVGRPITYGHLRSRPPLSAYQTIFARDPGSAEMPSAGRPFSARVLADLARRGVARAEITLHAGVSSTEAGEPPPAEWYRVPDETAQRVAAVRARGGRVVAVGTTVVRALESAADPHGVLAGTTGWTDLVLGPDRAPRVVDGLVTGWHEPEASHLLLLEAVAGAQHVLGEDTQHVREADAARRGLLGEDTQPVARAYAAALAERYRWHEFGDSCLLLARR